jgi:hypothetical protein
MQIILLTDNLAGTQPRTLLRITRGKVALWK